MDLPADPVLSFGVLMGAAFVFGLGAKAVGLPAMIGFLLAGVGLRAFGVQSTPALVAVSDLGVTLLMFVIGLKLEPKALLRPAVWAGGGGHALVSTGLAALALGGLSALGILSFADLAPHQWLLVGFGLAFSSTVFAAKTLDSTAETATEHGVMAIGILIIQDLFAVAFLTASLGKAPSPWALLFLLLIPARPLLARLLDHVGHGDLLVACGAALALFFGAFLFSSVGLKPDLGALIMGALLASHPKAGELSDALLGFKEVLLIGFFLNIGLSETITASGLASAALLLFLLPLKAALLLLILGRFRTKGHTAFRTTVALATYSEFGLIVVSLAVTKGWLPGSWLVVLAIALTLSFIIASPLNRLAPQIEPRLETFLARWFPVDEKPTRRELPSADALILGMGRLGAAAFDRLRNHYPATLAVDSDPNIVEDHRAQGRNIVHGDATDPLFWEQLSNLHDENPVFLLLPNFSLNQTALENLRSHGYQGEVYAAAHYPDEVERLRELGARPFYVPDEVGAGIAARVERALGRKS